MADRSRVAFATIKDSTDTRSWSGTPYYVRISIEKHLGDTLPLGPMPVLPRRLSKAASNIIKRLFGTQHYPGNNIGVLAADRWVAQSRLDAIAPSPDVIVALATSSLVANLRTNVPIIYSCDTTPQNMFDYYPNFTNLSKRSVDKANRFEKEAINRASLLYYPTQWAAQSAIRDYGAHPSKVHVQPYGANLVEIPDAPESYEPEDDICRLLMVGANWAIKGGNVALETFKILRDRGLKVELTVVGCAPPERTSMPGLTVIPFLNKNLPEDRQRLNELYRRANLFLLPTRCECFGIVFCEAAAYGLPVIASRTGGIPELVQDEQTGYTIPVSDGAEAYADRIVVLWHDHAKYISMRRAARSRFETHLNWDVWGRNLALLAKERFRSGNFLNHSISARG